MKRAKKKRLEEDAVIELVSKLREGGLKLTEIESYLRSEELRNLLNEHADSISEEISQRQEIGDEAYDKAFEWLERTMMEFLDKGYESEAIEEFFQSKKFQEYLDKVGGSNVIRFRLPHKHTNITRS